MGGDFGVPKNARNEKNGTFFARNSIIPYIRITYGHATNKKQPYETSELICNPISQEAFTQKWTGGQ